MKTRLDPRQSWWWSHQTQVRLTKWTLALLQGRRYRIQLEPNGSACLDLEKRLIQANPQLFPAESVPRQFRATQGLLAHEAGHALFTGAWPGQEEGRLQEIVNMLEDSRIENAICRLYPGIAPALGLLGDLALAEAPPVRGLAERDQAYSCCLVWRWAAGRIGEPAMLDRLKVTEGARRLWAGVRPLVEQAWQAPDTATVIAIGRQILDRLGIPPRSAPMQLLPRLEASRNTIPAKRPDRPLPFPASPAETQPGLGGLPDEPVETPFGDRYSQPAPYVELENGALPLARRLSAALALPTPDERLEPHDSQGRFTYRQQLRTPDMPFLLRQGLDDSPRSMALYLLVDRSGSMDEIAAEVRLGLMSLYLAATELEIPTGLAFFGASGSGRSDERVLEAVAPIPAALETARALIAGFTGETSAEFLDWGLQAAEEALASRPERYKVLIILHDGDPIYRGADGNDWELSYAHLRRLERQGVLVIGVYLGSRDECLKKVQRLFQRLVIGTPGELPEQLGNLLCSLV